MDKKTQPKPPKQNLQKKNLFFPIKEKEKLSGIIKLQGLPDLSSKHTLKLFLSTRHFRQYNSPGKRDQNIFLPIIEKVTLELLQKHHILDTVFRQHKYGQKNKTRLLKADITILGNKNLLPKIPKFEISENSIIRQQVKIMNTWNIILQKQKSLSNIEH